MNRTLLTGFALVVLLPGLALAQAEGPRRGRRGPARPQGDLPPGVHRVDPPAAHVDRDAVLRRIGAALKSLSQRVDRLEKGYAGLVRRLRQAHGGDRGRAQARRSGGRRGAAGMRAHRGGAWLRGGSMGSGGAPTRRGRAGSWLRGGFHQAHPMMKQAMMRRMQMARRAGMMRRMAGRMRRNAGPDAAGPRMPHNAEAGRRSGMRGPGPRAMRRGKAEAQGMRPAARRTPAARTRVAKAPEGAPQRVGRPAVAPQILEKARQLAQENAKLRAELEQLRAKVRQLIQATRAKKAKDAQKVGKARKNRPEARSARTDRRI